MQKEISYPEKEAIIFINEILNIMSNRKADQHKLLRSDSFIENAVQKSKLNQGDIYDKAATILCLLITSHGFASGNKRTAFIVAIHFLTTNGAKIRIKNFNKGERIIRNISRFNEKEIALWLRRGEINEKKIE
ncbi:MAG: type II toxin-antitoxin system death-on-curing family toxin [archaeon]|nr:type II toxin-antitoxin system death-on-curing family toxin [archaeon]